jgi:hypothetical protein
MTQQEKRIKIAELRGWTNVTYSTYHNDVVGREPSFSFNNRSVVPNYFSSLDACYEMEKGMTDDQRWHQVCQIVDYHVAPAGFPLFSRREVILLCQATATQRAESFGITMGLWEEGE